MWYAEARSADGRKVSRLRGIAVRLSVALALSMTCVLALSPSAFSADGGESFEGEGSFDVVVNTQVDEVVPTNAEMKDVTVHVSCIREGHVEGAAVSARIMKPSEREAYVSPAAAVATRDADAAVTAADGTVVLADAVIGATYRVSVTKEDHTDAHMDFLVDPDGSVWEVVLEHAGDSQPIPLPTDHVVDPEPEPGTGADAGDGVFPLSATGDALVSMSAFVGLAGLAAVLAVLAALFVRRNRKHRGHVEHGR